MINTKSILNNCLGKVYKTKKSGISFDTASKNSMKRNKDYTTMDYIKKKVISGEDALPKAISKLPTSNEDLKQAELDIFRLRLK